MEVVDPVKLTQVLPYLKREVFSGATAKSLSSNKSLLKELSDEIKLRLAVEDTIDEVDIVRINSRKVLNIVLIGVLIYAVVPQFNLFRGALTSIANMNFLWLIPITLMSLLTYVFSAAGLVILSSVPLRLADTSIVQLAASFMSKILPGGIGTAGLNARYLFKAGNDRTDTAAILATHNIIGFIMFIVPLGIFMLFQGEGLASLITFKITAKQTIFAVVGIVGVLGILALFHSLRKKVLGLIAYFATSIREFTNSTYEVTLTCLAALAVSLCYIFALYFSFKAFGVGLGLAGAILVYASAIIAKSVVPTPGGLGPLEIAMAASMVSLGVGNTDAVAVVVLYRLATFWLPIPFSLIAYNYISRRKII